MHTTAELWLGSLYVLAFGVFLGLIFWSERRPRERQRFLLPPPTSSAEATALEALAAMRDLVHQIGNNAHELALQFEVALNATNAQEQKEVREALRITLHRFIDITHQVAQIDARLSGYSPDAPRVTTKG